MKSSAPIITRPQVKICGLTSPQAAAACAELGADAIGCVFFPKSPRNLNTQQARKICSALPQKVQKVGVFVNEGYDGIMARVERCGLTAVQLHGQETPQLVEAIARHDILVIKALFATRTPALSEARHYPAQAFLAECGAGILPGGNARKWNWEQAREVADNFPVILAGGLSPANVAEAVAAAFPAAVDVSSGVEAAPGLKDLGKVKAFLEAVAGCAAAKYSPPVF